jgi:predicted phosphohydrolase
MDVFGGQWENYWENIKTDWRSKVKSDDLVLLSGDISWGKKLEEALPDLFEINARPGKKIMIKGNHEYWWSSYSKVKASLPEGMHAIQNDALRFENYIIAGTRGWSLPDKNSGSEDIKIYEREKIRLKLTLDYAMRLRNGSGDIIVMMHYPPFNVLEESSGFTEIIRGYPVTDVVYGHLHGREIKTRLVVEKDGIKYYLTSCDLVENKLISIR